MTHTSKLYVDQYGEHIRAATLKELLEKAHGIRATKIYADKPDGRVVHCGYIVKGRWLSAYIPLELPA